MKNYIKIFLFMVTAGGVIILLSGCNESSEGNSQSSAVNASEVRKSAVTINHRSPRALSESLIEAIATGNFDAVYETLSPDSRIRLDDFLAKSNESRENWMARLQRLWKIRLETEDLKSVLQDNDLYVKFENRLVDDGEFVKLNDKWYFVFK